MERETNDGQINDVDNCKDEIYKTVEQKSLCNYEQTRFLRSILQSFSRKL